MGDFDPIKRNLFNSFNQIDQGFKKKVENITNDNVVNQKIEEIRSSLINDPFITQDLRNDIFMLLDIVRQVKTAQVEKQELISFADTFINNYRDRITELVESSPNKSIIIQQDNYNIRFEYFDKRLVIFIE